MWYVITDASCQNVFVIYWDRKNRSSKDIYHRCGSRKRVCNIYLVLGGGEGLRPKVHWQKFTNCFAKLVSAGPMTKAQAWAKARSEHRYRRPGKTFGWGRWARRPSRPSTEAPGAKAFALFPQSLGRLREKRMGQAFNNQKVAGVIEGSRRLTPEGNP
jgi:hypothetical protein